ncbi:hypothetical protein SLNSH_10105 [Alsobacter soli]|uniref:Glycine zipper domain-containing protein n=1 Tax=Alsobacter soli TaxID=2109933 RepID=A0A2T1HU95_9HYPH|nr:hypothetical protein [Alsobacter soli]PSC05160.1 hypothetical protein SLNSH_10105 [Alsobacter soli]
MKMKALALLVIAAPLAACGYTPRDRAISGGLIGAGAGAIVGGAAAGTAGGALAGAAIGGVGGAIIGHATAPRHHCYARDRYGYRVRVRCY